MASITFHTLGQTVTIPSHEFAATIEILEDVLAMQIASAVDIDWLDQVLLPEHHLRDQLDQIKNRWRDSALRTAFRDSIAVYLRLGTPIFAIDGKVIDTPTLMHNSAAQWGSPAIQLAVKLHRHAMDHAYCEAEDREWLDDLIYRAREARILRDSDASGPRGNWSRLNVMLRYGPEGPIFTSQNPGQAFANRLRSQSGPDLGELPIEAQWELALTQARQDRALRIGPDSLALRYGHGYSGIDLIDSARHLSLKRSSGPRYLGR